MGVEWYNARFAYEHTQAEQEYYRLCDLLKDVLWYNFERQACTWKPPWRSSTAQSEVLLHARMHKMVWTRGVLVERCNYPLYFRGLVRESPALPVEVVLRETRAAKQYVDACKEQLNAAVDWAPGGAKYEVLRRTTIFKKRKFSQCEVESHG